MELRELFKSEMQLVIEGEEELPKYALGRLYYSFANGNEKPNLNGRVYPESLLKQQIEKKNEEIEESGIIGQLDHPLDGKTRLKDAMHILEGLCYDNDEKIAYAQSLILDTQAGRDFMTVLNTGAKLGASMRGWGTTDNKGRVQGNWKLESIDFVLNPSFGKDAVIDQTNLVESANALLVNENLEDPEDPTDEIKKQLRKEKIKASIDRLLEKSYDDACASGMWVGGWKSYHAEYSKALYEHYGITESSEKRVEKKEPRKKLQIKDIIGEAMSAGVDPKVYLEKVNAQIERENTLQNISEGEFTDEEIIVIRREAMSAGMPVSTPEDIKKVLEIARKSRSSKAKTLTEEEKKKIDDQAKSKRLSAERTSAGADMTYYDFMRKNKRRE